MSQAYSNPDRAGDPYALPNIEIFQMTAQEVAAQDEDLVYEYTKRHEFRLAHMNSRVRENMLDQIVADNGIRGGWFWWACFPGCLPDSTPIGPFDSYAEALANAQEE